MRIITKKTGMVFIITALLLALVLIAPSAADNQTVVKASVAELTITVDDTILGWGYTVQVDGNDPVKQTEKVCRISVSGGTPDKGGSTVNVVVRGDKGLPGSWYLNAVPVNCTSAIPENKNRVVVNAFTDVSASVTITAKQSGYVVTMDDYVYHNAPSANPTISPSVPQGVPVVFYYSTTSNGTRYEWSQTEGNKLNVGTYYIFATVDGVETLRSAFHVTKAQGILPATPTIDVSNMPVVAVLDPVDKGRNLQYSIDGGLTWTTILSAESNAGLFSIPGLQRNTQYTLLLKASETANYLESSARSVTFTSPDLTPVYKITYNANGGMNTPDDISFKEGESYVIDDGSSVYRAGYAFAGWYTAQSGGSRVAGTIHVTENLSLYAHWTLATFPVYFDENGGTGTMSPITTDVTKTVTLPANTFTNGTKLFGGWALYPTANMMYEDQATVKLTPDAETNTLVLYAVWVDSLYNVKITVTGGIDDTLISFILKKGNIVEETKTATVSGGTAETTFTSIPDGVYNIVIMTEDKILVTQIITVPDATVYTIPLPATGANSEVVVEENTPQTVAGNLDKEAEANRVAGKDITVTLTVQGREEKENYEGGSAEEKIQNDIQDIAVVAQRNGSTSVNYISLDVAKKTTDGTGTSTTETISVTSNVLEIVIPFDCTGKTDIKVYRKHADTVYILAEDTSKQDGTFRVDRVNNLIYIYSNKFSVYAIGWTVPGAIWHTILFDANSGTGTMDSASVPDEGWIVLPLNEFTAPSSDFEFDCWEIDGVRMYPGDTLTPTRDTTVYALWKPKNTWRVSFDANGGTGTMSPEYVIKGSSMVLPACGFTAPSGMLFSSWRIGSSFYEAGATYTPGADVTAYASWKSVGGSGSSGSATAYCLVQFETYDESIQIEDQYLMEGSLVKEPETPVEEGFVFGGWYTKEGKIWNFATDRVYYSMTLYAKWVPAEDRPPVNPVEPVVPVETPLGLIGVIAGLGAAAVLMRRK